MSYHKIKENIYSVGVLNPNLRIFDIIMETKFGTSYNSYIVKGENKTALIEAVHADFFDEFKRNISPICDISEIDYIILNHTEPDHTGSVKKIIEENKDVTVVGSNAAIKYLENISNCQFNKQIVKDNDVIDLGGKTLTFKPAPFLHWPDSMFTYLKEDKIVFTCDFLGAHYCENNMFDKEIRFKEAYEEAFLYYYTAIFGPFKPYVLKGLEKLNELDFEIVCPSHGPILQERISENIEKYKKWSTPTVNEIPKVLIVYVSAYGCTEKMASVIKDTLEKNKQCDVTMINAIEEGLSTIKEKIEQSDVLLFGSPTINRDAVKPIWDVLSVVDAVINQNKLCGVFGSYGWSGEAFKLIEDRVRGLKLKMYGEPQKVVFVPGEDDIVAIEEYAKGLAEQF